MTCLYFFDIVEGFFVGRVKLFVQAPCKDGNLVRLTLFCFALRANMKNGG